MTVKRALVACERSGQTRTALQALDIDAWSVDILPALDDGHQHIVGDALEPLEDNWDLLVAHPPCTYLTQFILACLVAKCSHPGHHNQEYVAWRTEQCHSAAQFFNRFRQATHIRLRAVENPLPHQYAQSLIGSPDAWSHPFWFGDPWMKRTGWWLTNLPPLFPTEMVTPLFRQVKWSSPKIEAAEAAQAKQLKKAYRPAMLYSEAGSLGPGMSGHNSTTSPGTAAAIASQWGSGYTGRLWTE